MNVYEITDPADEHLRDFIDVRDADLRRRAGTFLAEGPILVERLLLSGVEVQAVLLTPSMFHRMERRLTDRPIDVLVAPATTLSRTVGFEFHRGVVASATRPGDLDAASLLDSCRTIVGLEGVNDHENLGAIFRSALALGIDGVLLDRTCADPLYRRSVRVSMGATFILPFARVSDHLVDRVNRAGFVSLALTPDASAEAIDGLELHGDERVAVLVGAEGDGLSSETLGNATHRVRIPIRRASDSLNVGHAAAIAFHEVVRTGKRL